MGISTHLGVPPISDLIFCPRDVTINRVARRTGLPFQKLIAVLAFAFTTALGRASRRTVRCLSPPSQLISKTSVLPPKSFSRRSSESLFDHPFRPKNKPIGCVFSQGLSTRASCGYARGPRGRLMQIRQFWKLIGRG